MACYNIVGILVNHRTQKAEEVQKILTKYGCLIKMRLGLHEAGNVCSEEGLIMLQLCGQKEEVSKFVAELNEIKGVTAKLMEICS